MDTFQDDSKTCDSERMKRCLNTFLEQSEQIKSLKLKVKTVKDTNIYLKKKLDVKEKEIKKIKSSTILTKKRLKERKINLLKHYKCIYDSKKKLEIKKIIEEFTCTQENKEKELQNIKNEFEQKLKEEQDRHDGSKTTFAVRETNFNNQIRDLELTHKTIVNEKRRAGLIHQNTINELNRRNNLLHTRLVDAQDNINKLENHIIVCTVCLKKVDGTPGGLESSDMDLLIPCGHMICRKCLTLILEAKFPIPLLSIDIVEDTLLEDDWDAHGTPYNIRFNYFRRVQAKCPCCRMEIDLTKNIFISF